MYLGREMSDTINGIQRDLYEAMCEILKEFWRAQPALGDAAIEGRYAEIVAEPNLDRIWKHYEKNHSGLVK